MGKGKCRGVGWMVEGQEGREGRGGAARGGRGEMTSFEGNRES